MYRPFGDYRPITLTLTLKLSPSFPTFAQHLHIICLKFLCSDSLFRLSIERAPFQDGRTDRQTDGCLYMITRDLKSRDYQLKPGVNIQLMMQNFK